MLQQVRIERAYHIYNSGEVVAFPEDVAKGLIEQGVASPMEVTPAQVAKSKPLPKRQRKDEETVRKG